MARLRAALLRWYDEHRRDLPWRSGPGERPDPYRVWLSEVMLQQTRVETVKPYFERWTRRFPTVSALATATVDEVLKEWEGLGYYARARNLHRAARLVAERHAGEIPDDPALFRELPGVGAYTAGAVLSIAFGRSEPVVDGNVRRVFARWMDDPEPAQARLWALARAIVDGERPGDLNQALMELGATVCSPRSPRCGACPVRAGCAAHAASTQAERPLTRRAKPLPQEDTAVALVERDGRALLVRRPLRGRLGGLWEFPGAIVGPGETARAAAERVGRLATGVPVRAAGEVGVVEHTFTHVRVRYEAWRCPLRENGEIVQAEGAWVAPDELEAYALPRAQRRIAALWTASANAPALTRTRTGPPSRSPAGG